MNSLGLLDAVMVTRHDERVEPGLAIVVPGRRPVGHCPGLGWPGLEVEVLVQRPGLLAGPARLEAPEPAGPEGPGVPGLGSEAPGLE